MFLLDAVQNGDATLGGLLGLGTVIAGAIKWVGHDLVKALRELARGLNKNTAAVEENTEARKESTKVKAGTVAPLLLMLLALCLGGCVAAPDAMGLRAVKRDRDIWNEDRRADLDPELVKSRNAEFDAHERYFRGSKEDAAKLAEGPTR